MMTSVEFARRCREAVKAKTVYMKGAFGAPVTERILTRLAKLYPSYYTEGKLSLLRGLIGQNTFGFDCVCFIKGILWGWEGDADALYGGAAYESNGVPDFSVPGMNAHCEDISEDFGRIAVGEVVFMPGHVGVYVGDGLCVECTTAFGGGVLLSACNRKIDGYPTRTWSGHGKLKFVEYPPEDAHVTLPVHVMGDEGETVRAMQALLNLRVGNAIQPLALDGIFGAKTAQALAAFRNRLSIDEKSVWERLLKG